MPKIDRFFDEMIRQGGSDLHLEEGLPPKIRKNGEIMPLQAPNLTQELMTEYMREIATPEHWARFERAGDLDFAYEMGEKSRFRANYFRYVSGLGAIFRVIPTKILSLDQLEAPEVFKLFAELMAGLVLVTGPTGSGKSTTLAAIVNHINCNYVRKIITIEEPVEFMHENQRSLLTHREVGEDTLSFASGLRGAIRSDANVILVGEMRDRETIELALTATEMGILVFGTLHTNSAPKTIDRIVDVFPEDQKSQIRTMISFSLQGIVAQQLLRSADGSRRWAAHEILLYSPPLPGIIRSGDSNKLYSYIQTGRALGMITMDDCLADMVKAGKITSEEALKKATDKKRFA
ncbi:Type IV pilus twitching motility protein PilT [Sulfidibacter corallicola]|uniref:Type IV pilus twitching motility protein PilT n=1 Tax=Sulfidibacter corallicola TaxID=2818388 RepID=A0A8A4TE07_SULCO|nr:type IV pilus twitching motility protein PilT [Sulfidibacter corallicola]QTD48176.1 type IV pilus twitching motility protein PilT [Sulfidibacter corallicola]